LFPYDRDELIPLFGFGGIPNGMNEVSHCFPLNGDNDKPEVEVKEGVGAMLELYIRTLPEIRLSSPTYFTPLLKKFQEILEKGKKLEDPRQYQVLLILTDGTINEKDVGRTFTRASFGDYYWGWKLGVQ
jgi:Copine